MSPSPYGQKMLIWIIKSYMPSKCKMSITWCLLKPSIYGQMLKQIVASCIKTIQRTSMCCLLRPSLSGHKCWNGLWHLVWHANVNGPPYVSCRNHLYVDKLLIWILLYCMLSQLKWTIICCLLGPSLFDKILIWIKALV